MEFLGVLALTIVASFILRVPILKAPLAFYALSVAAVIFYFVGASGFLEIEWKPLVLLVQRCFVACALFVIVMFIGVLPEGSKVEAWLRPMRSELSIIASILCIGHVGAYGLLYLSRALFGSMSVSMLFSFCIAGVLLVLLFVLCATSFDFVKKRMSGPLWKNIQRLAYLFFALVYVHLMLMLLPVAFQGARVAQMSVISYSLVFVSYAFLRLAKVHRERCRIVSIPDEALVI